MVIAISSGRKDIRICLCRFESRSLELAQTVCGCRWRNVDVGEASPHVVRSTWEEEGEDDSVVGRGREGVVMGGVRRAFWCLEMIDV